MNNFSVSVFSLSVVIGSVHAIEKTRGRCVKKRILEFRLQNPLHSIEWSSGLEMALLGKSDNSPCHLQHPPSHLDSLFNFLSCSYILWINIWILSTVVIKHWPSNSACTFCIVLVVVCTLLNVFCFVCIISI